MTTYKEFHRRSLDERDAFWREQAQLIDWQTPFTQFCRPGQMTPQPAPWRPRPPPSFGPVAPPTPQLFLSVRE